MTTENFLAKKDAIVSRARYVELQQQYKGSVNQIHVFVEDSDDFEFYRTAINHIYHGFATFPYPMKGKQNLKDSFHLIDWRRYNRSKVLFFADKDLEDILSSERIVAQNFFYTKYYSVENYLVTEEVFCIILDRYYVNEIDDNLKTELLSLYRQAYEQFKIKMRTITWFVLVDRDKSRKAVLDNLKLGLLMHFEFMRYFEKKLVSSAYYDQIMRDPKSKPKTRNAIRNMSIKQIMAEKCGAEIDLFNFNNIMEKRKLILTISDHKIFVRGKYDLWFLTEILKTTDKTIEEIYKRDKRVVDDKNPMPRKKIEINNLNIFDLICPKMAHPEDVIQFLTRNFGLINGYN